MQAASILEWKKKNIIALQKQKNADFEQCVSPEIWNFIIDVSRKCLPGNNVKL